MALRLYLLVLASVCFLAPAYSFDLQGHRGARGLLPENTLPAFAKALSIGVTTLELDTGISKDGVVIVSHNPALDEDLTRDAQSEWIKSEPLIRTLTFDELQQFDVGRLKPGSRTAQRFDVQQPVDGTKMPSLAQVFDLVKKAGNSAVRFNIETKINPLKPNQTADAKTFAKAIVDVVKKYQLSDRVSIQSFDWRTLQVAQKLAPDIETVYLSAQQNWMDTIAGQPGTWTAGFKAADYNNSVPAMIKAAGGKVWSPFYGDMSEQKIKTAQDMGLRVIPWTINDKDTMKAFIGLGVDGIITDFPDRLRDVMVEMKMTLPAATPVQP